MQDPIVETWEINNRINLYLLEAVSPEFLDDVLASKGRSVAKQFGHIHNVRLMWLKVADPELFSAQIKIDTDQPVSKELLAEAIAESGKAISELLTKSITAGGKVKGFKPHVTAFLGYLTAHDSHHRSQIILALKQSGHPLDKKILYGIWEWGTR